jgi:hypothetical protein
LELGAWTLELGTWTLELRLNPILRSCRVVTR